MTAPPDSGATISALQQRAVAALSMHHGRRGADEQRALLFRDGHAAVIPDALLEDRVLEPIDKIVALVLLRRASPGTEPAYLPTQTELADRINVASRDTVSRALSNLRCQRWLTVCQRSLRAGNRCWPTAYVIHTAPLGIRDTLHLDPGYADYVQRLAQHRHARVRRVAQRALQQLPD